MKLLHFTTDLWCIHFVADGSYCGGHGILFSRAVVFYKCQRKPLLNTNKISALKVIKTAELTSFVQCLFAVSSEQMKRHKSRKVHVA